MERVVGAGSSVHVLRLQPGEELRSTLEGWAREQKVEAAAIVSAVGSLSRAHIRYGGREEGVITIGDLEVCSLSGLLSVHGVHLHLSVADGAGAMLGGHVLEGCTVRTTLELVILMIDGVQLLRTHDPATGYRELSPRPIAH